MGSQTLFPIADLHTHPLLPMYYFRKDLGRRQRSSRFFPYTPFGTHIDIPRLKESGVKLMVCCVFALNRLPYRSCFEVARRQIRLFDKWVLENSGEIAHARSASEIEPIIGSGRIALVLALEGGHHLSGDLSNLDFFREAGIFYITLVHFLNGGIAQSSLFSGFASKTPLTPFGRDLIQAMNTKKVIVDVAHCSEAAFWKVMEASRTPPIYSHGGSRVFCDHKRNLTDEQARALVKKGGLIGTILYPGYLRRGSVWGKIDDVLRHLGHWLDLVGPEALAIGSDMNGVMVVREIRDYAGMPRLQEAIVKAFGEKVARKALFENVLEYMKRHWS